MHRAVASPHRSSVLEAAASAEAGSVLIIDDEAVIRESLQTLLEMEGYHVAVAGDGEEGLARIASEPFDMVLLDYALPGRNGLEVLAGRG